MRSVGNRSFFQFFLELALWAFVVGCVQTTIVPVDTTAEGVLPESASTTTTTDPAASMTTTTTTSTTTTTTTSTTTTTTSTTTTILPIMPTELPKDDPNDPNPQENTSIQNQPSDENTFAKKYSVMLGTRQGWSWPQAYRLKYLDWEFGDFVTSYSLVKSVPFLFQDKIEMYAHIGLGVVPLAKLNPGFVAGFGITKTFYYGLGLRFDWSTVTTLSSLQNSDFSAAVTYEF